MSGTRHTHPFDARPPRADSEARSSPTAQAAGCALLARLAALATRIHARGDYVLREFRAPPSHARVVVPMPSCFPGELSATLSAIAGARVAWSCLDGRSGALGVPEASTFAGGWRAAAEQPGLGPSAVAYVVVDDGDGASRGLVVMDERGRCSTVWVGPDGEAVAVARGLDGYFERCVAHAGERDWPRRPNPATIDLPGPDEAASHARVRVTCRSAQAVSLDMLRFRRLSSLPCFTDLVVALGVPPERVVRRLEAMSPARRPQAVAQVLREARRGPQSIGELRRWALFEEQRSNWVDVQLEIDGPGLAGAQPTARDAWLAFRAAPGGEVALPTTEWLRLAELPHAVPRADDAACVVADLAGSVTLTVAAERCPTGCMVGMSWLAVLPGPPPTTSPPR
jgi:hypothetical protein